MRNITKRKNPVSAASTDQHSIELEQNIKLLLFNIIYKELHLKELEKYFEENGVGRKNLVANTIVPFRAKYFWLLNELHLEYLSRRKQRILYDLYNRFINGDRDVESELYTFLRKHLCKLLIPRTKEKYCYWGPRNFKFLAPTKAIVLAFHYIEFYDEDEEEERIADLVVDALNDLQDRHKIRPFGVGVQTIQYNEVMEFVQKAVRL